MMISWGGNAKESLGYSHCEFVTSLIWNFDAFFKRRLDSQQINHQIRFYFYFFTNHLKRSYRQDKADIYEKIPQHS